MSGPLREYTSSPGVVRTFCETCGTKVYYRMQTDDVYNMHLGTVDDAFVKHFPLDNVHRISSDSQQGYLARYIDPQVPRYSSNSKERVAFTHGEVHRTPDRSSVACRCHCGGIDFSIRQQEVGDMETVMREMALGRAGFQAPDAKKWVASVCVCRSCRRAAGRTFESWAFVPTRALSTMNLKTAIYYRSSPDVTRVFCGTCGATVFWHGDMRKTLIDVAVGLMDDCGRGMLQYPGRISYEEEDPSDLSKQFLFGLKECDYV